MHDSLSWEYLGISISLPVQSRRLLPRRFRADGKCWERTQSGDSRCSPGYVCVCVCARQHTVSGDNSRTEPRTCSAAWRRCLAML